MKNIKIISVLLAGIFIASGLSVSAGLVGPSDGGIVVPGMWLINSSDHLAPVDDRTVELVDMDVTGNITGVLEIANNTWMRAIDNAGTGVVNMFKVNTSDSIEAGATLDMNGNNITNTGNILPNTAGTTDNLGSATKEWANAYIGDAGKLYFGLGQDASINRSGANEMTLTATSGVNVSDDLTLKDDKYIYPDTAKAFGMGYNSNHSHLYFDNDDVELCGKGSIGMYANTSADASGNWDPYFDMQTSGIFQMGNTTQGSVGSKYLNINFTDGIKLDTQGAKDAFILADNITTADKTFQFPNYSGTFITSGNLTDITNVGALAGFISVTETDAGNLKTQVRHINSSNTVGTGGRLSFRMLDSNSAIQTYGRIGTEIDVNTAGSVDGTMRLSVYETGTATDYLILNGNTEDVGVTKPLSLANDTWFRARNQANTDYVDMFKVDTNDAIIVGGTLVGGSFEFGEDSGMSTLVDMPVSATPTAGDEEGYVFKVDGINIFQIYAEANSSGGIQNEAVKVSKKLALDVDARTIADSGDANPATLTLEPAGSFVRITCNDAHTCDITMSETNAIDGQIVKITNITANVVDFADTAGVTELAGAFAMGQYDTLELIYSSDRWIEIGRSEN